MTELEKEQQKAVEKVKEKSITIQENNLLDQTRNIENENNKSWLIIWFIGALIVIIGTTTLNITGIEKIILMILFVIPMGISLYNVSSKKVKSHIWINTYFVNRTYQYEWFLNNIHLKLNENYSDTSKLLDTKVGLTKLAYFFTILLLIFILFITLF